MPRFQNPTVLMTRPKDSSEQFIRALKAVAGPFDPVISPAFEYGRVAVELPEFDIGVFTSRAGVFFAPEGAGRLAYCVGDATARAATQAGYLAISAHGAADDLVHLILDQKPIGTLLHLRGETSIGDVTKNLVIGGLNATERVAYRKVVAEIDTLRAQTSAVSPDIILPLFSAETVSILAALGLDFSNMNAVAISPTVATAASEISPATLTIAAAPSHTEMVAAVACLIA